MGEAVEIHVTCPSREAARTIAEVLLERGLAACCNVGGPLESHFLWQGAIEREEEVLLAVKSRPALFETCAAAIRDTHPYDTPAIFGYEAAHMDPATADWLAEATKSPA